jgi:predicted ATP-grasp superfamily ATP-dependent carboligase
MTLNTTYPLLTAWLNNDLRDAWVAERDALRREDSKLLIAVADMEAAARLSAHITQEMERLTTDCWRLRTHHRFEVPPYTDEVIEFHDVLRCPDRKSYRDILSNISDNQQVWIDEERYLASIHYEYELQMEWERRRDARNAN